MFKPRLRCFLPAKHQLKRIRIMQSTKMKWHFIALSGAQKPCLSSWSHVALFRHGATSNSLHLESTSCLPSQPLLPGRVSYLVSWLDEKTPANQLILILELLDWHLSHHSTEPDRKPQSYWTWVHAPTQSNTQAGIHTPTAEVPTRETSLCGVYQLSKELLRDFGFVSLMKGISILLTTASYVHHRTASLSEAWWIPAFYPLRCVFFYFDSDFSSASLTVQLCCEPKELRLTSQVKHI